MNSAAVDVWTVPTEHTAETLDQERVMRLSDQISGAGRYFLKFQEARAQGDHKRINEAAHWLAEHLTSAAATARRIQRSAKLCADQRSKPKE